MSFQVPPQPNHSGILPGGARQQIPTCGSTRWGCSCNCLATCLYGRRVLGAPLPFQGPRWRQYWDAGAASRAWVSSFMYLRNTDIGTEGEHCGEEVPGCCPSLAENARGCSGLARGLQLHLRQGCVPGDSSGCASCPGLCLPGKRCPRKFRHRSKEP